MTPGELREVFPSLRENEARITSPEDRRYNCIAWAAGDSSVWWWPAAYSYWPPGITRENTLHAFVSAFGVLGYRPTSDRAYREGYEKVAIYVDAAGNPTHGARQLPTGRWTSKLGHDVDIEHDSPESLGGDEYGSVAVVLERPVPK